MTARVSYIELDLNRCALRYGVAPCTAELGTTGDRKCFNSFATCQDRENYTSETVTVRYSLASGVLDRDVDSIPSLASVDIRPARLSLGESIGVRASVTIQFKDHTSPDTGPDGDYYLSSRDYDPIERGTYWGKFRARQPFTRGQNIRVIYGDDNQSLGQMETRHFIIDSVAGPNSDGTFTIIAKDVLKLADGKQSQAPAISRGFLSADVTPSASSFSLLPSGIGDIDYPASGKGQIGGKEIVTFTRSEDAVTITARGLDGTTAVEHDEGDRFQLCLEYSGARCTDIIRDLLINFAGVSDSYIPIASWNTEDDTYIARNYTGIIAEPTAVVDLVNELLSQTASTIWWDDEARLLLFQVLRAVSAASSEYTDDIIVAGSFQTKDQPEKRVSQVWTSFGQINPLEPLDDPKNYRASLATVNLPSEDDFGGVPAIRQIFSRWIPAFARDAAERLNNLVLSRYSTPPRLLQFQLQRSESIQKPSLGGGYFLTTWPVQDDTGLAKRFEIQAIQVLSKTATHDILAEEVLFSETVAPEDPDIRPIPIGTSTNDFNLRDVYDTQFPTPDSDTVVNVTIEAGVTIGGSTTDFAFKTGNWPLGVTLNLVNFGEIIARGGDGGNGGNVGVPATRVSNGTPGSAGGDAIVVQHDINIDNANGKIYGGGGGGGGGGSSQAEGELGTIARMEGDGGGGGRGVIGSNGGSHGFPNPDDKAQDGQPGTKSGAGAAGPSRSRSNAGMTANSGASGAGGSYGQPGSSGSNGSASGSFENAYNSAGGSGGSAGRAISFQGGTATITATGDIRGAVV